MSATATLARTDSQDVNGFPVDVVTSDGRTVVTVRFADLGRTIHGPILSATRERGSRLWTVDCVSYGTVNDAVATTVALALNRP